MRVMREVTILIVVTIVLMLALEVVNLYNLIRKKQTVVFWYFVAT